MGNGTDQRAASAWNHAHYLPQAGTVPPGPYGDGRLRITRIAPGNGRIRVDWTTAPDAAERGFRLECRLRGSAAVPAALSLPRGTRGADITGLENGAEYELDLAGLPPDGIRAPQRLARPGKLPGTVVNYIHPEDHTYGFSGRSPASPSLVRLSDGALLASHDVYWGDAGQNLSKLFRSADGGRSWEFVTDLFPCFWGKLFEHRGVLYMLAMATEYGALLIGASRDGGRNWTAPSLLLEGGSRNAGGPHKAPMPVVAHAGRLWTAVDFGSWTIGGHRSGVISAKEDEDLLDPASWTVTPFLPYDPAWPGAVRGGDKPNLLEGNVVAAPWGGLVNLLRYHTAGGEPAYGKAVMLHVDAKDPAAPLRLAKVVDFPGNMSKFTVLFDPVSGRYWSLVNRVTSSWVSQRNILTLIRSGDLERWDVVGDVLDYENNGWPEPREKVGFQYVDWVIDGADILFLSRTALNGAYSFHNANHITFHRIRDFRTLGAGGGGRVRTGPAPGTWAPCGR